MNSTRPILRATLFPAAWQHDQLCLLQKPSLSRLIIRQNH